MDGKLISAFLFLCRDAGTEVDSSRNPTLGLFSAPFSMVIHKEKEAPHMCERKVILDQESNITWIPVISGIVFHTASCSHACEMEDKQYTVDTSSIPVTKERQELIALNLSSADLHSCLIQEC